MSPDQVVASTDESRSRPPKVAARLATNAPTNNETTSHNASAAEALRASSATCFRFGLCLLEILFQRANVSVTRCSASAGVSPGLCRHELAQVSTGLILQAAPDSSAFAKMRVDLRRCRVGRCGRRTAVWRRHRRRIRRCRVTRSEQRIHEVADWASRLAIAESPLRPRPQIAPQTSRLRRRL